MFFLVVSFRYYHIVVLQRSKDENGKWIIPRKPSEYQTSDLVSYNDYTTNRKKPYIAAVIIGEELSKYDKGFVIGDGERFSSRLRRSAQEYFNGPLFAETKYSVFQRAYTAKVCLILSWRRFLSYRNQSIYLLCESMDWFLYDIDLRRKIVDLFVLSPYLTKKIRSKLFLFHIKIP